MSSNDEPTDVQLDISKYEGHTEGPWKAFEDIEGADTDSPYRTGAWSVGNAISQSTAPPLHFDDEHDPHIYDVMGICLLKPITQNNKANAKLIADAPLLLEKVERLQRKLMLAESALGEIRAYHESGQGNLGEIIEHYQKNEQVEMPNAFDEDDA